MFNALGAARRRCSSVASQTPEAAKLALKASLNLPKTSLPMHHNPALTEPPLVHRLAHEHYQVQVRYCVPRSTTKCRCAPCPVHVCWLVAGWCAGVLVYWCAGVLVCWCAGVLACWCTPSSWSACEACVRGVQAGPPAMQVRPPACRVGQQPCRLGASRHHISTGQGRVAVLARDGRALLPPSVGRQAPEPQP